MIQYYLQDERHSKLNPICTMIRYCSLDKWYSTLNPIHHMMRYFFLDQRYSTRNHICITPKYFQDKRYAALNPIYIMVRYHFLDKEIYCPKSYWYIPWCCYNFQINDISHKILHIHIRFPFGECFKVKSLGWTKLKTDTQVTQQ